MIKYKPKWSDKELYFRTSFDTYLKLKYLRYMYSLVVQDAMRWRRWARKTKFKSKSEPAVCPVFVQEIFCGYRMWLNLKLCEFINTNYELARMPSDLPVEEMPSDIVDRVDQLYKQVARWFKDHRGYPDPVDMFHSWQAVKAGRGTVPLRKVIADRAEMVAR